MQITGGITTIVDKVQTFLSQWEKKYKHMWEVDKEAYIRRYEKAQKPLSSFEADIHRYMQLQDEVQSEETITNMRFLRIDCGPLKQTLVSGDGGWYTGIDTCHRIAGPIAFLWDGHCRGVSASVHRPAVQNLHHLPAR